ncbi:MAG: M67 family metallopeptidase [Alteraurantiacibacter sp.]
MELLHTEAGNSYPHECCGILLGDAERITAAMPAANVHPDPATHFEIDAQTLIDAHRAGRAGENRVRGYYHSHPAGPANPSATDRAEAAHDGMVWAIIAPAGSSEHDVSFWRDDESGFTLLPYAVDDG